MPRTYCRRSWLFHCPTNFSGQLFFCGRCFPSPRNAYHLALSRNGVQWYSSARSRTCLIVTMSAPPIPKSVRNGAPFLFFWPLTTTRTIQRRAPEGSTSKYRPLPSPCRPELRFSTSFLVSLPDRAIQKYHTPNHSRKEYKHYRKELKAIVKPHQAIENIRKGPLKATH